MRGLAGVMSVPEKLARSRRGTLSTRLAALATSDQLEFMPYRCHSRPLRFHPVAENRCWTSGGKPIRAAAAAAAPGKWSSPPMMSVS